MVVMDGQLVQVCGPSDSVPELIAPVENLRQEAATLRAEVQALHRANLELRQQVGYWRSRHRDALGRITALEQTVAQLEGEKRQLQADLFGRRSEAHSRNDRSQDLEDPQDDSLSTLSLTQRTASRESRHREALWGIGSGRYFRGTLC